METSDKQTNETTAQTGVVDYAAALRQLWSGVSPCLTAVTRGWWRSSTGG